MIAKRFYLIANSRFLLVISFSERAVSCATQAEDGAHAADAQYRTHAADAKDGASAENAPHAQKAQDAERASRAEQSVSGPAGMMPPRCFQVRLLIQHVSPENVAWWKSIIAPQERPDCTASFTAGTTSPAKTSACRSWSPEGQKMKVSIPCSRANLVSVSTHLDGGPSRGPSSAAPMLPETLYARRICRGSLPALSAPSSILRCISGRRPGGE